MLRESGSIERFFAAGDDSVAPDIGPALDAFSTRALQTDLRTAYGRMPKRPGVCYFFPRPSAGSACKRLNLFLRWMVRSDAIDLGVWTAVSPARLIIPLDTHVIRLGRCLRLTRYGSRVEMGPRLPQRFSLEPPHPVGMDFLSPRGKMNAVDWTRPGTPRMSRYAAYADEGDRSQVGWTKFGITCHHWFFCSHQACTDYKGTNGTYCGIHYPASRGAGGTTVHALACYRCPSKG